MRKVIGRILAVVPGGSWLVRQLRILVSRHRMKSMGGAEEIFTSYYRSGHWQGGGEQTSCGASSTAEYTEGIRKQIPALLAKLEVRRLLDAPCGDYAWFRFIERDSDFEYIGGDIVKQLVHDNNRRYRNQTTKFIHLDIVEDQLPQTDLWICRDCLFHLSNEDVSRVLGNFANSSIDYMLVTTHPKCDKNVDIPTGYFRELNLQAPPFNLCKPILFIDDWVKGFSVRKLGLWSRPMVENCVASGANAAFLATSEDDAL